MTASTQTRRAFVLTALATAGAAASVSLLLRARTGTPSTGITVAPGAGTGAMAPAASLGAVVGEMSIWARSIGQSFMARGDEGVGGVTLTAVQPATAGGARPAGIRQEPFWAHFSYPAAQAPKGNAIYTIDHPIAGLSALFMTRAPDQAGTAMLTAIFN